MPLINPNDTAKAAADMIEHLLDNRQLDAEPGHAAGAGSTQIVQRPMRQRLDVLGVVALLDGVILLELKDRRIQPALRPAEARNRRIAGDGEDEPAFLSDVGKSIKNLERCRR